MLWYLTNTLFVSFLIPQSQHTVSLYNIYVSRISIVGWKGLFSIWILLECPETIELIYLNPRNIPIPRYHRLSVGTGVHSHHDISPSLESYVRIRLPRSMSPWHIHWTCSFSKHESLWTFLLYLTPGPIFTRSQTLQNRICLLREKEAHS